MGPGGVAVGAAKGAAIGASEVGAAVLGGVLLAAAADGAVRNVLTDPERFVGLLLVIAFIVAAIVATGLLVAWLLRLPRWWIAVPAANAGCLLAAGMVQPAVGRAALAVAVFAVAGALAAQRRADRRG